VYMHHITKNYKKCYFKVLEKIEKNAHMYILCWHLFVQILA
jgi:hypothetical protein